MNHILDKLAFITLRVLRWFLDKVPRLFFDLWFGNDRRILPPITNPILLEPAVVLAARIRTKQLKCRVVVQAYIDRIHEVQPHINAVVEDRFQEALQEADQVDLLINTQDKTPEQWADEKPFLGIPFTTKDTVGIKGMCQTAGLVSSRDNRADVDADVIAAMRRAGAIPLATTNIPELVMFYDASNKLYGRTNNPYNFNKICGGSSGGEGSLIGAAGSVIGVGTDIGGSIRFPAFFCGIFGHKSSPRVISNEGMYPPACSDAVHDMKVAGPMCRYASDLLPMFKVMVGPDKSSKLKLDHQVDVRSLRIFYMTDDGGNPLVPPVQKDIRKAVKRVIKHFKNDYGMEVRQIAFPEMKNAYRIFKTKLLHSIGNKSYDLEMGNREKTVNPYPEFFKSLVGLSEHTMPIIIVSILQKLSKHQPEVISHYLRMCEKIKNELTEILGDDGVLITPGNPETAPYHFEAILKIPIVAYTGIFNALCLPATVCPTGLASDGLPTGVQVVAGPLQDRLTLAVARDLENTFGGWVSPCSIQTD